uniref:Uncharacterized protein n=1 Tax=Oryza sativa subsp. japonica TaxID=39947 RepID=Q6Z590_ORYSJ|nr:hypothetical protein [Oryza sativa Japonica Group]
MRLSLHELTIGSGESAGGAEHLRPRPAAPQPAAARACFHLRAHRHRVATPPHRLFPASPRRPARTRGAGRPASSRHPEPTRCHPGAAGRTTLRPRAPLWAAALAPSPCENRAREREEGKKRVGADVDTLTCGAHVGLTVRQLPGRKKPESKLLRELVCMSFVS